MKKQLIIGIAVLFITVGLSGCNDSEEDKGIISQDAKIILVNGGEWNAIPINYTNYVEYNNYIFFDDGEYKFETGWDKSDGNYIFWKGSGTYHISYDVIYLDEENRKRSYDGIDYRDVSVYSHEWSIRVINEDMVEIGYMTFIT